MTENKNYKQLMDQYEVISILESTRSVLSYDLETKMMPPAGLKNRGKQMSTLGLIINNKINSPEFIKPLTGLYESGSLNDIQERNVELLHRKYQTASCVPNSMIINLAEHANKTNQSWKNAKARSEWKLVQNDVSQLFELTKERAQMIADHKGLSDPQSALISERDPGFTVGKLTSIFEESRRFLVPLLQKVSLKHKDNDLSSNKLTFDRKTKVRLSETIADFYNYDYKTDKANGRIGEVEHPLTIRCGPEDARITVNYKTNYTQVMSSTQHELGHGLHGLHKPKNSTPIATINFPSISEMTSRYTENKIGKERAFWNHYFPIMQDITSISCSEDEFYKAFTHVSAGNKRMNADEISYGLHIIIRFELEKDLFVEKLNFDEIPHAWSEKYKTYLGVDVPDDTAGPLQDLHWFSYYWCYFQGYHLGDLLGSQIHDNMQKLIPTWKEDMANGNMKTLNSYLNQHIYQLGAQYDPLEFVEKVTGKPFNTKYLKQYLEEKYL